MKKLKQIVALLTLSIAGIYFQHCSEDSSTENKNKKEKIEFINVTIWSSAGGPEPISDPILTDDDGDGVFAPDETFPVINLSADQTYTVGIWFGGEFDDELAEEKDDHLFCYNVTNGVVAVTYGDEDSENRPVGQATEWTAKSTSGTGNMTITLRHQPGTKTGACSNEGEVDFEITLPIEIFD